MTAAWAGAVLRERGDPGPVTARRTPTGAEVYAGAELVLKVHRPGTDATVLRARLRAAARLETFLSPADDEPL